MVPCNSRYKDKKAAMHRVFMYVFSYTRAIPGTFQGAYTRRASKASPSAANASMPLASSSTSPLYKRQL